MVFQLWSRINQVHDSQRCLVPDALQVQDGPESLGAEEGGEDGAEPGDGVALGGVPDDALVQSRRDGAGLGGPGEDVVDGLVHAEEVEENAAVDAQPAVGRQEAGEVLDGVGPRARLHQIEQVVRAHEHVRLSDKHFQGAVELVAREEGDEPPLPEAGHAGELRRAPALAGDGEAELAAGLHRSL